MSENVSFLKVKARFAIILVVFYINLVHYSKVLWGTPEGNCEVNYILFIIILLRIYSSFVIKITTGSSSVPAGISLCG